MCRGFCEKRFQQGAVCLQGAGLTVQVGRIVELGGIYKDADYGQFILCKTTAYEGGMASMKCAHRWYKTDAIAVILTGASKTFGQLRDGMYNCHDGTEGVDPFLCFFMGLQNYDTLTEYANFHEVKWTKRV